MWAGIALIIAALALFVFLALIWALCCTAAWADDEMAAVIRKEVARRDGGTTDPSP